MDWTDQMDDTLKKGIKAGLSASLIAKKIGGGITRNAVLGRSHRMGWYLELTKVTQKPGRKKHNPNGIRPEDVIDRILDLRDLGLTWREIGENVGLSMQTARNWAFAYGGLEESFNRRYFTPEDEVYIAQAYADHVPVENIADKLGRSFGVIRQKVLQLQKQGKINTYRDPHRTRLLRQYGARALEAGDSPQDALHKIQEAKRLAFANAMNEARKAKTVFKQQAVEEMMADIAAGVDRNEAIFKARAKGVSLNEISDCFNITRERVRQICSKHAELIALQQLIGEQ